MKILIFFGSPQENTNMLDKMMALDDLYPGAEKKVFCNFEPAGMERIHRAVYEQIISPKSEGRFLYTNLFPLFAANIIKSVIVDEIKNSAEEEKIVVVLPLFLAENKDFIEEIKSDDLVSFLYHDGFEFIKLIFLEHQRYCSSTHLMTP